jgi:hypothetical protein
MNYNPMLDYQRNQLLAQQAMIQNQLNQMNYHQPQAQFNPYPQNNQPQFFVRQVGNIEEAKSYPVDPNTMYFFLDTGNGKIYMKQLNSNNGKSDFYSYVLQENIVEEKKTDPIEEIKTKLSDIENKIGVIYDKSISSISSDKKSNGNVTETNAGQDAKTKSANVSAGSTDDKRQERK